MFIFANRDIVLAELWHFCPPQEQNQLLPIFILSANFLFYSVHAFHGTNEITSQSDSAVKKRGLMMGSSMRSWAQVVWKGMWTA